MCGIAGVYRFDTQNVSENLLREMCDVMKHRGPNDEGYYINKNVGLGNRRLSIIDLSKDAHQPLSNEKDTIKLTHNGEIYNYQELTDRLISKGHKFRSRSDTETIVHCYEEYGEKCLQMFNGMFAFALWDERKRRLFCARDRFGIKPFYYYWDKEKFVFASEVKALLVDETIPRSPNHQMVYDYLVYGHLDHTEHTFFDDIKRLLPSHYLVVHNGNVEIKRYWDIPAPMVSHQSRGDALCAKKFYDLFESSVKLRLRSDVPIGTCLSGGLDSSAIVCVANTLLFGTEKNVPPTVVGKRQKTFSACSENKNYDEREYIELVLAHTGAEKNYTFLRSDELVRTLPDVMWCQEEPFGGASMWAQWHVMRLAKEKGVTVLLDGQGGDETLGGYLYYFGYFFAEFIKRLRFLTLLREVRGYSRNHPHSILAVLPYTIGGLLPNSLKALGHRIELEKKYLAQEFVESKRRKHALTFKYMDLLTEHLYRSLTSLGFPALLRFEDKNAMAFSIESRVPFLDHRLVSFLFSLSPSQKMRGGVTKIVLRNAMKNVIPEKVRLRMDKVGFVTPEDLWYRTALREYVEEIIGSPTFKNRGYFTVKYAKKSFEKYCVGGKNISWETVSRWVLLELWFRMFIDPDDIFLAHNKLNGAV